MSKDDEVARRLLETVGFGNYEESISRSESNEVASDHITDIHFLPGSLERLASLPRSRFALLYGEPDGTVVSVGVLSFEWSTGSSMHDIRLANQAANDVLQTRGRSNLELVGLYMPELDPEQLERYLDVGLGFQVVMGGKVSTGPEGELQFQPRAISRNQTGKHFLVRAITP